MSLIQGKMKCVEHTDSFVIYFKIKKTQEVDKQFICPDCIEEIGKFDSENYCQVSHIIDYNDILQIKKWPPLNQKLMKQIKSTQTSDAINYLNTLQQTINEFFENLYIEFKDNMDPIREKMIKRCEDLKDSKNKLLNEYINISQLNNLKNIFQQDQNTEQKEIIIKDLINKFESQIESYTETLEKLYKSYQEGIDQINQNSPEQVQKEIIKLMNQISFFNTDQKSKEIEQIMGILKVKSNYLKEEFLSLFEKHLIQSDPHFKGVDFGQIFKNDEKFKQFQQISDPTLQCVEKLIEKKYKIETGQNEISEKTKKTCEKILELLQIQDFMWEYDNEDVKNVFFQYTIFTLESLEQSQKYLEQLTFKKQNEDEQDLDFQRDLQHQIIFKTKEDWVFGSDQKGSGRNQGFEFLYSEEDLDPDKKYMFRLMIKKENENQQTLKFGLVKNNNFNQQSLIGVQFDFGKIDSYINRQGINKDFKIIKGDFNELQKIDEIEIRISIKDKFIQILDYPEYQHILQLSDRDKLNEQNNLKLFFGLTKKADLTVTITDAQTLQKLQK